jgi:double-stranded uracil-DNA glycosylase
MASCSPDCGEVDLVGFSREELEAYEGATVPDLLGDDCRLLWVGINPGLWTAATGTHFCHPSNRFYPALTKAGLVDWSIDTDDGMTEGQRSDFAGRGMGITNLVARATVRASELVPGELRKGARRLASTVKRIAPTVVAVAGVTAFRIAFANPGANLGIQPDSIWDSELWVVPNPSGLNAHETIDSLAGWYARVGEAAGLI